MSRCCIRLFFLCISLACVLSSCINSDNETVEVSNDCAVSNVVLGTLKRHVYSKNTSGKDSVYLTSLSGSLYRMYVDHLNREIYNPDSLPLGTNIKKVVFSAFSSDGTLAYRKDNGVDTLYAITDTIDFTNPRIFTCYAFSGVAKRSYTVRVNVHKVNPEDFKWQKLCVYDDFKRSSLIKAFAVGNKLQVFSMIENMAYVTTLCSDDFTQLDKKALSGAIPSDLKGIVYFKNVFYGVCDGKLVESLDGVEWDALNADIDGIFSLPACSGQYIYALRDKCLFSSENLKTWKQETLDASPEYLPVSNFASTAASMSFNDDFEYVFMSGMTQNNQNVLWKKVLDKSNRNMESWSYYPSTPEINYPLPSLKSPSMICYDGKNLYIGCQNDTISNFYVSKDVGRTWLPDTENYIHPYGIHAIDFSCIADNENYVWLICAGSGEVWRGRINRLSFAKNQTAFTE